MGTGFASPAEVFRETPLDLNRLVINHPQATFFMRAEGDAMQEDGIHEGDILVVDRALKVRDNNVVVAAVFGELVVRRVKRGGGRLRLLPAGSRARPLEVGPETAMTIWGVVTHVLHDLRVSANQ